MSGKRNRASELRAIADGRLLLNVRNGVTVSRSMLAMIADEFEAMSTALAAKDAELAKRPDWPTVNATYEKWKVRAERAEAELARRDMQLEASAKVALDLSAQLAEARKALGALDRMNRGLDWCDQDEQARRWSAARRALEGGTNE